MNLLTPDKIQYLQITLARKSKSEPCIRIMTKSFRWTFLESCVRENLMHSLMRRCWKHITDF
ncbi:hypothetical protein COY52_12285 [Candidatus Desantisbacteria bacterium CG_4_10_14_0_8_um_filter_48_22]|uniref:Uncharacterized protein n=1 Tax=Candidatus Desantisbacteria bacterium CG_4_10_14_0_8_um_filter_48_22 TaxID=1974543 RepID=A0A2M7S4N4_9BACT|nr:MAG: hypothetical protein COY52_12285 [Candidatus Desantisbacteria bacterium CG_4_10_14_0_8_um_filter_48_22]